MSDATAKTITVTVDGQPKEFPAEFLNAGSADHWRAFIADEARKTFNPWVEFGSKISVLPPDLQAIAIQAFIATGEFRTVPEYVVQQVTVSLRVVALLGLLVTGEDFVTEANLTEARAALFSFVENRPAEVVCESLADANARRAALGKPPIGASGTGG